MIGCHFTTPTRPHSARVTIYEAAVLLELVALALLALGGDSRASSIACRIVVSLPVGSGTTDRASGGGRYTCLPRLLSDSTMMHGDSTARSRPI